MLTDPDEPAAALGRLAADPHLRAEFGAIADTRCARTGRLGTEC